MAAIFSLQNALKITESPSSDEHGARLLYSGSPGSCPSVHSGRTCVSVTQQRDSTLLGVPGNAEVVPGPPELSRTPEGAALHISQDFCGWRLLSKIISHASKVMLKILQARLQQYVNCELPDVQAGFRKGRGTRDQIANIHWIIEKAREFQKNIYFFFIDYAKAFDCVDHNKLWKILKEMGIPDHLTCLLRNLYAGQDAS